MLSKKVKRLIKHTLDWSHWPHYLFYFPLAIPWLSYYVRSRSLWFFTPSNPTLAFGGFEGEGKRQIYEQLPEAYCPKSIFIKPGIPFSEVMEKVKAKAFQYPFIVKPDVGMKGILFRKIESPAQLEQYHRHMPADYIIQEFLDLPLEVSVFYCRWPDSEKGQVTAMIQKNLPEVYGDGRSTLGQLIESHEDAGDLAGRLKAELNERWNEILPVGEKYCLSHVANLFHGARFIDLHHHIDEKLTQLFDFISLQNQFYYGRYDIKCTSVEEMKQGKNFYILEFNGAGSVPNHIYAGRYNILSAYKEVLKHWRMMYDISRYNHKHGHPMWSLKKGHYFLQESKKHFDRLKQLDKELILQ